MKSYFILILTISMFSLVFAKIQLPELTKKHGPLYLGVRTLILSEKHNAELTWNETQRQMDENSDTLYKILHYIENYETIINDKLNEINKLEHSAELKKCYKQHERQIARFNRELLENYFVCKQALNSSLSQLKDEVKQEIQYIHDAAAEILELKYICNVTDLKRNDRESHHATVTMCILSNLAEINQHILEATQVVLNIIARMIINQEENLLKMDLEDVHGKALNICLEYDYLREEFETIYDSIMMCVENLKQ